MTALSWYCGLVLSGGSPFGVATDLQQNHGAGTVDRTDSRTEGTEAILSCRRLFMWYIARCVLCSRGYPDKEDLAEKARVVRKKRNLWTRSGDRSRRERLCPILFCGTNKISTHEVTVL